MRLIFALLLTLVFTAFAGAENSKKTELEVAIRAFNEAKALGHKATTLIHARRIYFMARKYYFNQPSQIAPYALSYADASAQYGEKRASLLYNNAVNIYVEAHGLDDPILIRPLTNAAEYALSNSNREVAYAWFLKAKTLAEKQVDPDHLMMARVMMGIAQLHMAAGDYTKAKEIAQAAIKELPQNAYEKDSIAMAKIYQALGQIEVSNNELASALNAYKHALAILLEKDPNSRRIYELHQHLVGVNHKLGDEENAEYYCKNALRYRYHNIKASREPFYDPNNRLIAKNRVKSGHIRATLTKSANCRLKNIEVHETQGISLGEARRLLEQAYYVPMVMNGKVIDGEYASLITADLYSH